MAPPVPAYKQMMELQRKQDAQREISLRYTEESKKMTFLANWENKTDDKVLQKRKNDRIAALRAAQQSRLLERKRRLAGLLNEEMNCWQETIMTAVESVEDRNASISRRAIALRDARESERRAYVDECYRRQWKDSCDDGRHMDAQEMTKYIKKERVRQMRERAEQEVVEKQRDDVLVDQWLKSMAELDVKEQQKEAYRREMEKEIKGILDQQVELHEQRKVELRQRQAVDAAEELTELRQAIARDELEAQQRLEDARRRGHETRDFNDSRLNLRQEAADRERQEDLVLLKYAMDKERSEIDAELRKKREEQETTKRYQAYLKAQMIKEAENTALADSLRKADEDRIWAKREAEQKRRDDARAHLMKVTNEGRQQQIRNRLERERKELEEDQWDGDKFAADRAELDRIEAEKEAKRKQNVAENLRGIRGQIDVKRQQRMKEEQDKYLEAKIMQKVEAEHRQKLSEQAGTLRLHRPKNHTAWYT